MTRHAASRVNLDPLLNCVRKGGQEAGWSGADQWSQPVGSMVRSELRICYLREMGEKPVDINLLTSRRDGIRERQLAADTRRAQAAARLLTPSANTAAADFGRWSTPRAVAVAALLGMAGLIAGACGVAVGAREWMVLFLAGVLLLTRPWGLGAAARSATGAVFGVTALLYYACRSYRLAHRAEAAERAIERESLRCEQCERWVSERAEWLLAQYEYARRRGEQARLIEAEGHI